MGKGRYIVDVERKLYDVKERRFIVGEHNDLYKIVIGDVTHSVSMDWLLAATFKPMWNSDRFLLNWTVLRSGGSELANLYWKPPLGGQDCDVTPGFKIIPHLGKYSINHNGTEIINREKHVRMGIRKAPNGYLNFNVVGVDGWKLTVGVHRAVALAWLEYDDRICNLVANHKYGNKENNNKDDLEWSTYAENNEHARDTGLKFDRSSVLVKDYLTGEVTPYNSTCSAARAFNTNPGNVYSYLVKNKDILRQGRYLFRFDDGIETFPELSDEYVKAEHATYLARTENGRCTAQCIVTGTIVVYETVAELMKGIGIDIFYRENVYSALDSLSAIPILGYILSRASNIKPMRIFTPDEIEFYKYNTRLKGAAFKNFVEKEQREKIMPMRVYDHFTGVETKHLSSQAVADFLNVTKDDIRHYLGLKAKYPFAYRWSIQVAHIDKPWRSFTVEELVNLKQKADADKERLKCMATNIFTGETIYAEYPAALGKIIGIDGNSVAKALASTLNYPHLNYFFSYQNKPKPVPTLKEDEIAGLRDKTGIMNPIRATFPDGSTKVFADAHECGEELGLGPANIAHMAIANLKHRNTGISFEKVKLV